MTRITTAMMNFWKDEEGQDLIEYALLALLIALAVTALLVALGGQLNTVYQQIIDALNPVTPVTP